MRTGHVSVAAEISWAEIDRTTAQHVKVVIRRASMLAELSIAR